MNGEVIFFFENSKNKTVGGVGRGVGGVGGIRVDMYGEVKFL